MSIKRVAIDDHLPSGADDPELPFKVRNLTALRPVAIGLDQIVNRSLADVAKWGHVDPFTQAANEADLAEARKQLRLLEAALETGRAMIAAVEAQSGVVPEPEPKKASRRQSSSS